MIIMIIVMQDKSCLSRAAHLMLKFPNQQL